MYASVHVYTGFRSKRATQRRMRASAQSGPTGKVEIPIATSLQAMGILLLPYTLAGPQDVVHGENLDRRLLGNAVSVFSVASVALQRLILIIFLCLLSLLLCVPDPTLPPINLMRTRHI